VQVCGAAECRSKLRRACTKRLPCGHACGGLRGEAPCLPCVRGDCLLTHQLPPRGGAACAAAGAGACLICLEQLDSAPCLRLRCGAAHVVHAGCARARLEAGAPSAELSFGFLFCPACGPQGGEARAFQVRGPPVTSPWRLPCRLAPHSTCLPAAAWLLPLLLLRHALPAASSKGRYGWRDPSRFLVGVTSRVLRCGSREDSACGKAGNQ
jgi:hypothetical protein